MAARVLRGTTTTPACSLRQLPGHQCAGIYKYAYYRSFSSTTPRRLDVVDTLAQSPLILLETLHAVGLPWWAVIPTTAVVIRGIVAYHFGGKQAYQRLKNRVVIGPAIATAVPSQQRYINYMQRQTIPQQSSSLPPAPDSVPSLLHGRSIYAVLRSLRVGMVYRRRVGAQFIRPMSFVSLALFVVPMEAIRLKLGGSGGLLRWMASLVYGNSEVATEAQHAVKESVITPQVITLDDLVKPPIDAITTDGLPVDAELSVYDPTTTLEGLSFCTDLTIPDPTGTLPALLMVGMLSNVVFNPRRADHSGDLVTWFRSFTAVDWTVVSFAVFICTFVNLPAGLYLYWIASTIVGRASTLWMAIKDPMPVGVQACAHVPRRMDLR